VTWDGWLYYLAMARHKDATTPGRSKYARIIRVYDLLLETFGPQHWWPGDSPFEMITGAILTQSAAWTNVEKAIGNLKRASALSPAALRDLPLEELAQLIYPSGYYNAKAAKIKAFVQHLAVYEDDLGRLFATDVPSLRRELLGIHGVGEETADSIILYAAGKPSFVIDAYTRRIFRRLGIAGEADTYGAYRSMFQGHLPADPSLYNEYHALLVKLGKEICQPKPRCGLCPLHGICPAGKENTVAAARMVH